MSCTNCESFFETGIINSTARLLRGRGAASLYSITNVVGPMLSACRSCTQPSSPHDILSADVIH